MPSVVGTVGLCKKGRRSCNSPDSPLSRLTGSPHASDPTLSSSDWQDQESCSAFRRYLPGHRHMAASLHLPNEVC